MTSVDRLARDLAGLRHEVKVLATTPRLARSSIDGGNLEIRDVEGNTTGYVGEQFDGTFTVAPVGGSYPSTPTQVMVTPVAGGLRIYWDGSYDDGSNTRMDFKRVVFYAVPTATGEELDFLSPTQNVGEITTALGGEIIASLPPEEFLVYAVTWTEAGKFSPESEPAFGTPLSVVDQDEFDALQVSLDDLNNVTLPALDAELAANSANIATATTNIATLQTGLSDVEIAAQEAKDDAAAAVTQAAAAKAAADGAIRTFGPEEYPTSPPWANGSAQDPNVIGDLWLNADGVAHRWNGTTWYVIPDSAAAAALAAAQDARDVADAAALAASSAQGEVDTLEGRVVTAEGEIDSVTTRVTTAEGTLTSVSGRVTNAETAVSNHETRIDTAEGTLTTVDGRLDSAESTIGTHSTRLTTAEGNISTVSSDVSTLDGSVSSLTTRVTTAEGTVTNLDTRVDTAESTISNHTTRLGTAEGNITSVTNIANGKTKTTYSTATPGTTANTAGDTWFRLSGSEVIGIWKGNGGTSWTAEKFGGAVLDHLDAGTITAGIIAAERIGALSITTGHLAADAVTAAKIQAGSIDTTKIVTAGLDAATIKFGTMSGARIEVGTLSVGAVGGLQATLDSKETPAGAQAKADAAATAAETAAKTYADAEAEAARLAAIATASGDASDKAAAAEAAAIAAAAADALTKANTAKSEAISTAASQAATAYGETKTLVSGWRTTGQTTIDGGKITADSVKAAQIAAGAIDVTHLTVADFTNLVADGDLADPTMSNWGSSLTRVAPTGTTPAYIEWSATTSNAHRYNNAFFEARPGDKFYIFAEVSAPAENTANITVTGALQTKNASGATVTWPNGGSKTLAPGAAWTPLEGVITIPAGDSVRGQFDPFAAAASGTQKVRMRSMMVRRMATGKVIVDGEITATKIGTDAVIAGKVAADAIDTRELKASAVTANEIAADAVVAGKVSADAIGAREIIADSITATELQVGAVTADRLDAKAVDGKTVTGAIVRTAVETAPRLQLDSQGLTQYEFDSGFNLVPTTRIGSGQNKFTGSFTAEDIMVQGGLELYGQDNAFGSNSKVTLRTGQGAPTVAPGVTTSYQTQEIGGTLTPGYFQLNGYLQDGATEYGAGNFFGSSRIFRGTAWYALDQIKVTNAKGEVVNRIDPWGYTRIEVNGVQYAAVMGNIWDNGQAGDYPRPGTIWYNDSAMNTSGTVAPTEVAKYDWSANFSWFEQNFTGRFLASTFFGTSAKAMQVHATHNTYPGTDRVTFHRIEFVGGMGTANIAYRGGYQFQFGAHRVHPDEKVTGIVCGHTDQLGMTPGLNQVVWVLSTTHQNIVLSLDVTTRLYNEEWPVIPGSSYRFLESGSVANNTLAYYAHLNAGNNLDAANEQRLTKYSNWRWSGAATPIWLKFAWRGHSSKTTPEYLTAPGPAVQHTPVKRANVTVSIPALPPPEAGQNAARNADKDIYGWVLYGGQGTTEPARTSLWRQYTAVGDPTLVQSTTISSLATSGTNPLLATQGFPSLSPAKIVSSAGDGNGAFLSLDGDGNIKGKTFNGQTLDDTGEIVVPAFASSTSWQHYDTTGGYGPMAYSRKNGVVYVTGLVTVKAGGSSNADIFVLPAGFRPRVDIIISLATADGPKELYLTSGGRMFFPAWVGATAGKWASVTLNFRAHN